MNKQTNEKLPGTFTVKVLRSHCGHSGESGYQEYSVPWSPGMSAMDALDYIYQNLDGSLAYYDHAGCALGACARCMARINGKPGLLCQTLISNEDLVLEPFGKGEVIRDLITG